jgi:hypothetical protein
VQSKIFGANNTCSVPRSIQYSVIIFVGFIVYLIILGLNLSHRLIAMIPFYFSVLGGLLMVGGLYSVLWGKQRDNSETKPSTKEEINCQELPVSKNCTTNQDHAIIVCDFTK